MLCIEDWLQGLVLYTALRYPLCNPFVPPLQGGLVVCFYGFMALPLTKGPPSLGEGFINPFKGAPPPILGGPLLSTPIFLYGCMSYGSAINQSSMQSIEDQGATPWGGT
jgi:hypothetical protein